jgi:hypothetical protein
MVPWHISSDVLVAHPQSMIFSANSGVADSGVISYSPVAVAETSGRHFCALSFHPESRDGLCYSRWCFGRAKHAEEIDDELASISARPVIEGTVALAFNLSDERDPTFTIPALLSTD